MTNVVKPVVVIPAAVVKSIAPVVTSVLVVSIPLDYSEVEVKFLKSSFSDRLILLAKLDAKGFKDFANHLRKVNSVLGG